MERLTAARAQALGESIRRVDPLSSDALLAHAPWLRDAEAALREANIQLAALQPQTVTVIQLRDRIDTLLDVVPRARPISQADEE